MNLAIDFGTSFTKIGYMQNDSFVNLTGLTGIPTVFAYIPDYDKLVFGYNALQMNHKGIELFPAFKLMLKRNLDFSVGSYTLYDILLNYFSFLNDEYIKPNNLVPDTVNLCVPNYFGLNARQLLIRVLNAIFKNAKINLVPEPVAALAGYTMANKNNQLDGDILVIDIGGGTTDFSFLTFSGDSKEIIIESQLQMGQDVFSGIEIDKAVLDQLLIPILKNYTELDLLGKIPSNKHRYIYKNLLKIAEKVKIEVSNKDYSYINEPDISLGFSLITEINSEQFLKVIEPSLRKLQLYLEQNIINKAEKLGIYQHKGWQLDHIILLGGASQTKGLYDFLADFFSPLIITKANDTTLNVVKGLAIWSNIINTPLNIKTIYPFSFYVQKYNNDNNSFILEPLLFDTSILELDINGKYNICSLPVKSPYNLSTNTDSVKFMLYEVEEEITEVSLDRFIGQEIVLNLELTNNESIDYIDIKLDMGDSKLTASYPQENSEIKHYIQVPNIKIYNNPDWLNFVNNSFNNELNNDLEQFLNEINTNLELSLEDHLEMIRFKLLTLLQYIS